MVIVAPIAPILNLLGMGAGAQTATDPTPFVIAVIPAGVSLARVPESTPVAKVPTGTPIARVDE